MPTYTVRPHHDHWHIDVDGDMQGPYPTAEDATAAATEIAEATAQSGETAVIEVESRDGHVETVRRYEAQIRRDLD
jgi:hypothetical protein